MTPSPSHETSVARKYAFTPGPWEFRVYSNGCTIVSQHCEPGRTVRAWLKGVKVSVDADIDDDQSNAHEASPDARLIASAPSLYEALELADLLLSGANMNRTTVQKKVRGALAKARGE
jgi:hypothetical protein